VFNADMILIFIVSRQLGIENVT